MKLKPVHVDGWLYLGIGVFGAMVGTFSTDAAYKYIEPFHLFWYKAASMWALAGATALKTFRSTSYADSLQAGGTDSATDGTRKNTDQAEPGTKGENAPK